METENTIKTETNEETKAIEEQIKRLEIEKQKCQEKISMYSNTKNKLANGPFIKDSIEKTIKFWNEQFNKRENKIKELSKKINKVIEKKETKKDGKKKNK